MRRCKSVLLVLAAMFAAAPIAYASSTTTYTYDARGRLKTVSLSGGTHSGASTQYNYDTGNNRVRKIITGA